MTSEEQNYACLNLISFLHLFFLYASFSVILVLIMFTEVILDRIICSDVLPCTKYWLTHGEAQIFLMPFPLMDGVTMLIVPSNQAIKSG